MSKEIKRNKLKIVVIGFLIIFIPLIFFSKKLEDLYISTKEDLSSDLKQKILSVSTKFKSDLETYNYINSEISKIHAVLFPDFKEEITDKILDESFAQNLYKKETFDKLVLLTKEKFAPIFISFATNNLEKYYAYYSPELEQQFENQDDKIEFSRTKTIYDIGFLARQYEIYFKSKKHIHKSEVVKEHILYKYLTRFKFYQYHTKTFYTDYFGKQLIFNISKYSFSKTGIHGYYSLIIPQSQINPDSIINSAINNNSGNEVKIKVIPQNEIISSDDLFRETNEGCEYIINLPTELKNQINTYQIFQNEDKSYLLNKAFKLNIVFPKELEKLRIIYSSAKFLTLFLVLLYIVLSIKIYRNKYKLSINLTHKLILVLSAITFLPIIGVGLLTWISTQKFTKLIDYNVSQNLSNEMDNIFIINEENNQRHLSYIYEMKNKIEKNCFTHQMKEIKDGILSPKDTFFRTWTRHLVALSQDNSYYIFNHWGRRNNKEKIENSYGVFLPKYANNLNILNKSHTNLKDDMSSTLTLGTLENYITSLMEEQSAGQESVPHRHLLVFNDTSSAVYFYVKDSKKQHNLLINVLNGDDLRYKYITGFRLPKRQNWFEAKNDYSEINLGIAISDHFYIERNTTYPITGDSYRKVNDIITKSILSKDSISEKAYMSDGNIAKKCIYTDNDPFVIGGLAKSNYNTKLTLGINMVFPLLLAYALFLMFLLTGFISVFIKEPVKIYKEAIDSLENKEYGITIDSFSKDEFDSITSAFNEMSLAVKQKLMISRYVSDRLIQSINQDNIQEAGNGKLERVTILSSDIRNFTGTSEKYEPSVIVEMLNSYFTKMQQAISENGGIIDKYIGDAIQAVFYDEPEKENQVIRASKAALAMRKALEKFNRERKEAGLFTIQNGIGIDTDIAITGTIGTVKGRKDFSVNGDVVGRAADLEAKTKLTESKILISKKSLEDVLKPILQNSSSLTPNLIIKEFDSESVELIDVR
ncbi:MAG: adenylate/guanylate cyclase domain-containing protein [Candidatus Riflebacteria bacterium]|nr:adenylate/guanylate cyclase domain-containing protein [Candidatus Riflebacteria bacterium]